MHCTTFLKAFSTTLDRMLVSVNVGQAFAKESTEEKLLGFNLDKRLSFLKPILSSCFLRLPKNYTHLQEYPFHELEKACSNN